MGGKNPVVAGVLAFFLFPLPMGHWYVNQLGRGVKFSLLFLALWFFVIPNTLSVEDIEAITEGSKELPVDLLILQIIFRLFFIYDCVRLT